MKKTSIGGQAVMEGVMMKNLDRYAVAVRKPDHEIEVMTDEYKSLGSRKDRQQWRRLVCKSGNFGYEAGCETERKTGYEAGCAPGRKTGYDH